MQDKVGATRAADCGPSCVLTRSIVCRRASTALLASAPAAAAPATVEGTLETIVEDHPQAARTRHFLKTGKGRIGLRVAGRESALRTGSKVRASLGFTKGVSSR